VFSAIAIAAALALASPNPTLPSIRVVAPRADLTLETANTPAQRERGLMSRTRLAAHTGMLFVFDSDGPVSFWMKDTLIPLDMIFVATDGTVREIFSDVRPVAPGTPDAAIPLESANARYVIELAAGEAARDGIVRGVRLCFARAP